MYIYDIQSDRINSFHPKHSNLENTMTTIGHGPSKKDKQVVVAIVKSDAHRLQFSHLGTSQPNKFF